VKSLPPVNIFGDAMRWRFILVNRRQHLDTLLRWTIMTGGLCVLAIILLLVIFLVANALPLLTPPEVVHKVKPKGFSWLNATSSWRSTDERLPLIIQDPEQRLWAGGQWRLWISDQALKFDFIEAKAEATNTEAMHTETINTEAINTEASGANDTVSYPLTKPLSAACAHPTQGLIYVLTQQGHLYPWFWVGNQTATGEWQQGKQLTTFSFEDALFQAQPSVAKAPKWGMICHPTSPWTVIWNQHRWWLWSVATEQVLATDRLKPALASRLLEMRFAHTDNLNQLIWGLHTRIDNTTPLLIASKVWSYDQNHTGLMDWKSVLHEARPLGSDQAVPMWAPDTGGQSSPAFYNVLPLLEGSFKVAILALLLATPLSLSTAIYSSHFMSVRLRGKIKPMIELIEAVPTVVLGFIAVLVFGPWLENHLFGFLWVLLILPLVFVVSGVGWSRLPLQWRRQLPAGWEILLVFPLLVLSIGALFSVGEHLENRLFDAGLIAYLNDHLGINYQNRNALLTGLAMGVALIPTLYSIAEDALYTLPKSLRDGSLALGATPWQTLSRVILPMASPGIFAALMIGFGRALGETMIVLMASGNSANTSWNIFEGLRSLSATLVLEMPAANLYSTHYHMLFLLALFLFGFTFAVNSVAEWIRYRLRVRYGAQG
jgi:ABC-type phosphate transport system permease subunit